MGRIARVIKTFTEKISGSGRLGTVASVFEFSGDRQKVQLFGASNEDAPPPVGTQTFNVPVGSSRGFNSSVAYRNDKVESVAVGGEVRRFSTNETGETVMAEYFLHGDGTIELKNANGSVTISPSGNIETKNSIGSVRVWPDGTINSNNGNGSAIIRPDGDIELTGGDIELNGDTYHLTMYEQLKAQLDSLVAQYNLHWHNGTNSSRVPEVQQDLLLISGAKANTLLTDG